MNKRVWVIKENTTGSIIDKVSSLNEANEMIRLYEKADISANIFRPHNYEIICKLEDCNESNMLMNEYQTEAMKTATDIEPQWSIIYPAIGLNEEAGEVVGKIKRVIREHRGKYTDIMRKEIALEIGDCLWNLAVLASNLGFKLSEIAEMNNEKLQNRVKNGTINGSGDNR